jgi:hypothetical protein
LNGETLFFDGDRRTVTGQKSQICLVFQPLMMKKIDLKAAEAKYRRKRLGSRLIALILFKEFHYCRTQPV